MHESDDNIPWGDEPVLPGRDEGSVPPPMPTIPPPTPTTTTTLDPGPSAAPVLTGSYGETRPPVPDAPAGGSGRLAWVGAIIGALVLLVGGGYFALTALSASGGAATPEEAVEALIEAIDNEDVITLGELLEPGERRTIVDPTIEDIVPELVRLGVLADRFDAGGVDGVDFELIDVTYRIDSVAGHDDLVHVAFTGGRSASSTQVDEFPFGEPILRRFGGSMQDEPRYVETIEESDNPLVLVRRDDRWYVSLWYSLGEAVRLELDETLPLVSEMPTPRGASSPEAAVEQLVLNAFDFDLAGMVAGLDPEEAHALYRYSPLFLDDAQSALQDARSQLEDEGLDWSMTDMDFDVDRDGDDAIVRMRGFTFRLTTPDVELVVEYGPDRVYGRIDGVLDGTPISGSLEITPTRWYLEGSNGDESIEAELLFDADAATASLTGRSNGESFEGSLTIDDTAECSRYSFTGFDESESGCLEEALGGAGGAELSRQGVLDWFALTERDYPAPAIAVHETDGGWYVSPTLTVMHAVVSGLESVEVAEFEDFLDQVAAERDGESVTLGDVLGAPLDAADELRRFDPDGFGLPLGDDGVPVIVEDAGPDRIGADDGYRERDFVVTPAAEPTPYRNELLDRWERHVYEVEMTAGQSLGVTLTGESGVGADGIGDPFLTVQTPDGTYWESNDDFDGLDSGLQFTADRSGSWRVIVEDLNGGTGVYELTLELPPVGTEPTIGSEPGGVPPVDPSAEAELDDFEEISIGGGEPTVLTGSIEAGVFDVYAFQAPAGTTLTVSLTADPGTSFDPYLIVRDTDLEVIADNDDAPFEAGLDLLDSQVVVVVERADAYYVEVRSFADASAGSYRLTIESA